MQYILYVWCALQYNWERSIVQSDFNRIGVFKNSVGFFAETVYELVKNLKIREKYKN